MTDPFSSPAWFLRPEDWLYWTRDTVLPSNDPWNQTPAAGSTTPVVSNGGILGNLATPSDKLPSSGGLLGNVLPAIDASTNTSNALPTAPALAGTLAPPDGGWGPNSLFWLQTVTPFSATGGVPVTDSPPINQDPFERAAARTIRSVRPEAGRQQGAATHVLETYVPHTARGLLDLIALPGRKPVPMPKGLQVNDAGEWLVNGQPAVETAEGRAWLEDQQRRMDWGPAVALLLELARPRGDIRTPPTRAAAPAAEPEALPQPPRAPARSSTPGRLFDYSRLDETPDVPQFDLERYVPSRGVPERIRALANPATIERLNEAVRQGAERGGREFYNTEPLREEFVAELGPEKGQAAYDKYLNLVGATSLRSRLEENIRNAAYHYMRSQQGFPPPASYWDGKGWRLAEPLPPPWGHAAQGLHAKKIREALARGGLSPLTDQKSASFVQNLRGNQRPVTIDRHNTRLLGVTGARGQPVDAPPRGGYGFLERLQQEEAAGHDTGSIPILGLDRRCGTDRRAIEAKPLPRHVRGKGCADR